MIETKSQYKEWVNIELKKLGTRHFYDFLLISERQILSRFIKLLRKTELYINTNKKIRALFYSAKLEKMSNKYCLHIPPNTIGRGLHIMHVGPILINENAKIGNDVSIHINVSVVAGGTNDLCPTIDDGVILGVGSVVRGDVYLAKNIAVGANSVVTKSFCEEDICIAGCPAKKVSNNGRSKWNRD